MKEFIIKWLDLFYKEKWLRKINKELDKCNNLYVKANEQLYAVDRLIKSYNEMYPDDKIDAE